MKMKNDTVLEGGTPRLDGTQSATGEALRTCTTSSVLNNETVPKPSLMAKMLWGNGLTNIHFGPHEYKKIMQPSWIACPVRLLLLHSTVLSLGITATIKPITRAYSA